MQMYLFEPLPHFGAPFRAINGDDSPTIVYHEYTHGLSNRLVVDDAGLRRAQRAAVGRDGRGVERLVRQGLPRP